MESKVAELPVSDKLWAWFETNKKPVMGFTVLAVLVGVIVYFVLLQQEEKATAASDSLSSVLVSQLTGTGTRPETAESAEALLKVAGAYPKSTAATRALLLAGADFFAAGKYAEAQAQYEKLTREFPDSPLRPQALLGIAASLDAQGKTDQALAAYKDLTTRQPSASVIPQAKFGEACLYESQQKLELARDLFTEVEREDSFGPLGMQARVRLEDLLAKNPKLVPAPPTPVNPALQPKNK